MKLDVVVDVGNSRIKWGRCAGGAVTEIASLPPEDPAAWQDQLERWGAAGPLVWVVAGVHPARRDRLADWLRQRGDTVRVLNAARELPLRVLLEYPDRVGIDRLFNAVAANRRRPSGCPVIVVSAGSAIVVDYVDENGAFGGGAIFPGLHLMAQALHAHTALLPLVEPPRTVPGLPGTTTPTAIEAGIFWTAVGGIQALADQLARLGPATAERFLTGGDGQLLAAVLGPGFNLWPAMTLEGIRLTAETLL